MPYLSVSEVARRIRDKHGGSIRPPDISGLFYTGKLRDDLCPIVSGRRLIPDDYLPLIVAALKRAGKLPIDNEGVVSK